MICKLCNQEKDSTEFYVSNKGICKECIKERVRQNRLANLEYYQAYDRNRKNKAERTLKSKEYKDRLRKEDPEKFDKIFHGIRKKYRETHRTQISAENKLDDALRCGKIIRPNKCSICNAECIPHGHHFDYSKPLEVIWVCANCHGFIHKYLRTLERVQRFNQATS